MMPIKDLESVYNKLLSILKNHGKGIEMLTDAKHEQTEISKLHDEQIREIRATLRVMILLCFLMGAAVICLLFF